jgi:salicylate hydroxylase
MVRKYEDEWQRGFRVPVGPAMDMRDAHLRAVMSFETWEQMDEETFKHAWDRELMVVGHDAAEKVADWWTQWGSYFEKEEKKKDQRPASSVV